MIENTDNVNVQNQVKEPVGGGLSQEMREKMEAIGVYNKGVESPAIQELREYEQKANEPIQVETQAPPAPPAQSSPPPSLNESINNPTIDNVPQEQNVNQTNDIPQAQITSEADRLQDSQNPTNVNPYFIESEVYGGRKVISAEDTTEKPNADLKGAEDFQSLKEEYERAKTQLEAVQNDLASLPPDIAESVNLWATGEDYTKPFSVKRLNYNLEPQDIGKKKLVDHYFNGEVDDFMWESADKNSDEYNPVAEKFIDNLYKQSVDKFRNEKESHKTQAITYRQQAEERGKKINDSIQSAMTAFDKKNPDASAMYRDKVYKALVNDDLKNLIYNPDGTYKETAALAYLEMTQGENLREQLIRIAKEKARSEANEEIVSRSTGANRLNSSGGGQEEFSEEFKRQMAIIKGAGKENVY
jgi:hypothetical protein